MSDAEKIADAIYELMHAVEKTGDEISLRLGWIASHLEDINANLSEINKSMPNLLDVPE